MGDTTKLKEVAVGGSTPSAKDDKKREASSPIYAEDSLYVKKTRHFTGDTLRPVVDTSDGTDYVDIMHVDDDDTGSEVAAPTHHFSRPLYPSEIIQIASDLRAMMLPEIKLVVKEAVSEATQSLKDNIQELRNNISDIQTENELLKKENKDLESRMAAVEQAIDGLEQYSRRNSLRISGYPEDKDERTDQVVIQLAGSLGVDIASNDIDRSHRVGKFDDRSRSGKGPGAKRRARDIIVKFATYNARDKLYQERKELRNTETLKSVFLNKDLTKKRSKLLYDARTLAHAKLLNAAYSLDKRHLVKTDADIKTFGDVEEAKKIIERLRALKAAGAMGSGMPSGLGSSASTSR